MQRAPFDDADEHFALLPGFAARRCSAGRLLSRCAESGAALLAKGISYPLCVSVAVEGISLEIEAAVGRARAAWPSIAVDDARFAVRLVEILGESPIAAANLHVEDL